MKECRHILPYPLLGELAVTISSEQSPKESKSAKSGGKKRGNRERIYTFGPSCPFFTEEERKGIKVSKKEVQDFNEGPWASICAALTSCDPYLWEVSGKVSKSSFQETRRGLQVLEKWMVRSWFLSGPDYLLPRLKAIFSWTRYYSAFSDEGERPGLPQGTLGKAGEILLFPWATGRLAWLREVPYGTEKGGKPDDQIVRRLSFFSAGKRSLPPGTPKVTQLSESKYLQTVCGTPTKPDGLELLLEVAERYAENYLLKKGSKKESAHLSLSNTGCFENGQAKGGRSEYVSTEFLEVFLSRLISEEERESLLSKDWDELFTVEGFRQARKPLETPGGILASYLLKEEFDPEPLKGEDVIPKGLTSEGDEDLVDKINKMFEERVKENPQELLALSCVATGLQRGRITIEEEPFAVLAGIPLFKEKKYRPLCQGPRPVLTRVATLPEKGYKTRVVTVTEGWYTVLLHLPRSCLYRFLSKDSRSTLFLKGKELYYLARGLSQPSKDPEVEARRLRFQEALGRERNPLYILSSDLTAATDETYREVYDALVKGTMRGWEKKLKGSASAPLSYLPLASLATKVAEGFRAGKPGKIEDLMDRMEEEGLPMQRGYPMGNPCTWFLLNLLNLLCLGLARVSRKGESELDTLRRLTGSPSEMERFLKASIAYSKDSGTKVCGDDLVSFETLHVAHAYGRFIKLAGNRLSEGAHLISRTYGIFTEDVVVRDGRKVTALDIVFLKSLTPGLENKGDSSVRTSRPPPFFTRGSALSTAMVYLPEPGEEDVDDGKARKKALSGLLYQIYRERLKPFRAIGINVFLPTQLGGLGFPYYRGKKAVARLLPRWQRKRIALLTEGREGYEPSSGEAVISLTRPKKGKALLASFLEIVVDKSKLVHDSDIQKLYEEAFPDRSDKTKYYFDKEKGKPEISFRAFRQFRDESFVPFHLLENKLETMVRRGVFPRGKTESKRDMSRYTFSSIKRAWQEGAEKARKLVEGDRDPGYTKVADLLRSFRGLPGSFLPKAEMERVISLLSTTALEIPEGDMPQ